jgi:hypothetical protein
MVEVMYPLPKGSIGSWLGQYYKAGFRHDWGSTASCEVYLKYCLLWGMIGALPLVRKYCLLWVMIGARLGQYCLLCGKIGADCLQGGSCHISVRGSNVSYTNAVHEGEHMFSVYLNSFNPRQHHLRHIFMGQALNVAKNFIPFDNWGGACSMISNAIFSSAKLHIFTVIASKKGSKIWCPYNNIKMGAKLKKNLVNHSLTFGPFWTLQPSTMS